MCIMEIHDHAHRNTMIQAIAHNLSTVDRDLDMLVEVGNAREDHELALWAHNLQVAVHRAYADALTEFGISLANHVQDDEGHIPVGNEQIGHHRATIIEALDHATKEAKRDETR